MRVYKLQRVYLGKLYLFTVLGLILSSVLMVVLVYLITLFFPGFDNVNVVLVLAALFFGFYLYKISFARSSETIRIQVSNQKLIIEEREILLTEIKRIKLKRVRLHYYPLFTINVADKNKIQFRVSPDDDVDELVAKLKTVLPKNTVSIF